MSALTCNHGTCVVPNMVALHQSDPRILQVDHDPRMPPMLPVGCYDASIVMVANAALANRRSGLGSPVGRTAIFDAIASTNGQVNVPKEVNQLIFQYHTAIDHAPYYLQELVADAGGGSIVQSHDPKDPAQWTGLATNGAGAAFRDWVWDAPYVDHDYVKGILDDRFALLLAFGRYTPTAVLNPATGRYDVTLVKAPANQHKVVISGYQAGAYPLRVNDPGSGTVTSMRLVQAGSDLRQATRGFGVDAATGQALGAVTFQNHDSGQLETVSAPYGTFLEYTGTGAATDPVLLLEHVDALSLDWRGGTRVWTGRWGPWTHMATFTVAGQEYLLTYDRATQMVQFARVFDGLRGADTIWRGTWGPWTHILPFTVGDTDYLLTYNRPTQMAMISRFLPGLNGVETIWQGTWGPWSHLVPFRHKGEPYLLAYNRDTQMAMTSRFWGGLNGVETIWQGTWGPWSHLVPLAMRDRTYLVAYDEMTGLGQIARFFPGLNGTEALSEHSWPTHCNIAPVRSAGLAHFTLHRQSDDSRTLYRIAAVPDGELQTVAALTSPNHERGASIDLPFTKDAGSYQLAYFPATQDVEFIRWRPL